MRKFAVFLLPLLLLCASVAKDNSPNLPKLITQAKYVYVTTLYGDGTLNPRVSAEDRQTIAAVEQALRDWGRYTITMRAENADLLIVLRKGGYAKVQPGITIGGDSRGQRRVGTTVGLDAGTSDDMLAIYDAHSGLEGSPLWRGMMPNGLGSELPLFAEFRRAVEKAASHKN